MADNLTPEQRRRCMSRVRNKDTKPERLVRTALHKRGLRFRKHVRGLPGTPDVVFTRAKVAVFVDGDYWHGYRFRRWCGGLSEFWREKISKNRRRDFHTFRALRAGGWQVIRVWQHSIKNDLDGCVRRIEQAVRRRASNS